MEHTGKHSPTDTYTPVSTIQNVTTGALGDWGQNVDDFQESSIAVMLWLIFSPILIVFGLTGNLLSYLVLRRKFLRAGTCSFYLRAIAIVDSGKLVFGLLPIFLIKLISLDITILHSVTCKLRNFCTYSFGDVAVWFLVMFTLDRYVAICLPLRRRSLCTVKRARVILSALTLMAIAKNGHIFWTRDLVYVPSASNGTTLENYTVKCGTPEPKYQHFAHYIRPWIVMIFVDIIPSTIISLCNFCIIIALTKWQKRNRQFPKVAGSSDVRQMALSCVAVSVVFLILVTPSMIILIGQPYWKTTAHARARVALAKACSNLCIYLNHSINILLYSITGENFRKELISLLSCKKSQGKPCLYSNIECNRYESRQSSRLGSAQSALQLDPNFINKLATRRLTDSKC